MPAPDNLVDVESLPQHARRAHREASRWSASRSGWCR